MCRRIENRLSVRKLYTETLMARGDITLDEAEKSLESFSARLQTGLDETRQTAPPKGTIAREPSPSIGVLPHVETGVASATLDLVAAALHEPPEHFTVHPKLAKQLETRKQLYAEGQVDWALGEALAFGTILLGGTDIRLSGQDTRRGTFSQRHSVLVCYDTGVDYTPLSHLSTDQGRFRVYDSLLSEYAALGFEYGYSVVAKDALVAWEAQFGDFVNGAQIVIDQFLVAAEDKWQQTSGLVLLLPHGYEGQGPEHSSARVERFLTMCAEDNVQVVNCTTAAQYFHVLRRQVIRSVRKPLIIFTPKSLLRARQARSRIEMFTRGSFEEVLDDPTYVDGAGDATAVERVVLATGKVAYDAMAKRDADQLPVAVVRVEQLYPWPEAQIAEVLARYERASLVIWLQEEPENMGPWSFVHGRLHRLLRDDFTLRHVSRPESGSPATGSSTVHQQEQEQLVARALSG